VRNIPEMSVRQIKKSEEKKIHRHLREECFERRKNSIQASNI
jgi:hypothetical protein